MKKEFIIIDACNYDNYPIGGQSNFARYLSQLFGDNVHLVGISTGDVKVGEWIKKKLNGINYNYFAFDKREISSNKPLIPLRLRTYYEIRKYKEAILSLGVKRVFTQSPEILFAISSWNWHSICYRFPGVRNPLTMPRYRWGTLFKKQFDYILFKALNKVDIILISADDREIEDLIKRSNGKLNNKNIFKFPTRANTDLFYPIEKIVAIKIIGINNDYPIFVVNGKLAAIKGWKLIIDSFKLVLRKHPSAKLYFVGDGEDRTIIEETIKNYSIDKNVIILGMLSKEDVALFINASDLVLSGSYIEGWPTSIVEAIVCGKAVVSTDVSGARDMIINGKNGFIVKKRDPIEFANKVMQALELEDSKAISLKLSENYKLDKVKNELAQIWLDKY
jgi:glycosyltransferase involved in cell wall biosynthesis